MKPEKKGTWLYVLEIPCKDTKGNEFMHAVSIHKSKEDAWDAAEGWTNKADFVLHVTEFTPNGHRFIRGGSYVRP